jgi:hypothetical protein
LICPYVKERLLSATDVTTSEATRTNTRRYNQHEPYQHIERHQENQMRRSGNMEHRGA